MPTKYGVDELKKIAETLALVVNVVSKMLSGNILAVFEIAGALNVIKGIKFDQLKNEIGDLDPGERQVIEQAFALKLDLTNQTLEQKLVDASDALNEAIDVVEEAVKVFDDAKAVVLRFKTIIGV